MLSSASGEKQLMACVSVIQTMENGVGIGVGEGVGIGVGAGVALCTGEGTKEFSAVCSEKAALVQPTARPASRKRRNR